MLQFNLLSTIYSDKTIQHGNNIPNLQPIGLYISDDCVISIYQPEIFLPYNEAEKAAKAFFTPGTKPGDWDLLDPYQIEELLMLKYQNIHSALKSIGTGRFHVGNYYWAKGSSAFGIPCGEKITPEISEPLTL